MTSRRQFMMTIVPAAAALSVMGQARAADAPKVDAKKYPTYKAGSVCGNCQFFQGKAGDAWGACPLLGGKQVNAKGWCSAYAKKA